MLLGDDLISALICTGGAMCGGFFFAAKDMVCKRGDPASHVSFAVVHRGGIWRCACSNPT